jgi:hypothetical protein
MPFHRIIWRRSKPSADFTVRKPALTQNNLRNVLTNCTPERHAFSQIIRGSSDFPRIIRGKLNFVHKCLREFAKNIKLILDVHQGPIRC